ncbi:regulatory protein, luxR family [Actinacidiphila alni]|uniref:Regulatory protein, luxR family n=1 Tax=Actinacidiphila alni TaxID=380248 RepID=A0A1I2KIY3_9ACTN|nr:helix-turn-helix transcriptional regulator [Actinacidiphila alni]SFF66298.1 regulatory protein, luxR family [Actinacidiphila alni]
MRHTATHDPVNVEELVGACLDGASLLVEIAGEPGSGRTRLLGELAAAARRGGLLVTHGLQAAPPGRGLLRCLDDLDLAGPATAEPLRRLLAEPPTAPTVVTYSVSTGTMPAWLVSGLAGAGAHFRPHRIPVAPLTPEVFAAQLPPGTGPMREALLYELSGGVPGWLDLLTPLTSRQLRELATSDHAPGSLPVPANCARLREFHGLAPEQIEVARCAAVLGDPFAPALVADIADRATAAVLTVLDELVARDLMRPVDGGAPLFRFRHPLLRTLVYATTPPGRRITAHARAARALARVGAPVPQRAPHLARSAEQGDRGTADALARAARTVLDSWPATAASWLRTALHILPDTADGVLEDSGPAARFRIAALLYHAAERTGQYAECRHLLPVLLDAAENGTAAEAGAEDLLERAVLVDLHARLEDGLGRRRFARSLVDAELAAEPAAIAPSGARLLRLRRATMAAAEGDLPAARSDVAQALGLAGGPSGVLRMDAAATLALAKAAAEGDLPAVRSDVAQALGLAGGSSGVLRVDAAATLALAKAAAPPYPTDAVAHPDATAPPRAGTGSGADDSIEAALRTAESLTDAELAGRLDAAARLGEALGLADRYGDALGLFDRAVGIARRTGRVAALPRLLLGRARARTALGRLSAAQRDAHEAEETAAVLGDAVSADRARLARAWAALWCDGPDDAAALADDVLRRHPGPGPLGESAAGVLGWARLAQGRPDDCLDLVLPVARGTRRPPAPGERVLWWSAAATAAWETGAAAAAREFAALAADGASACRTAGARAEALVARARHTPDEGAVRLLTAAVEASAVAGLAVLECRARLDLAQRLLAAGRLEDAAAEAGRAKEWAERTNARWLRAVAVNTQRRIGACRPRRTAEPQRPGTVAEETLSVREEQILGMVCQGMSNGEVAGALFVSVKTVEAHLTRIFRKTGARSRSSLVAAFAAARPVARA